jgi:hypothetical protein
MLVVAEIAELRAIRNNLMSFIYLLAVFGLTHINFAYIMSFVFNNK